MTNQVLISPPIFHKKPKKNHLRLEVVEFIDNTPFDYILDLGDVTRHLSFPKHLVTLGYDPYDHTLVVDMPLWVADMFEVDLSEEYKKDI
jgi:hypothetical protein